MRLEASSNTHSFRLACPVHETHQHHGEQIASALDLGPAFDNVLRNVGAEETMITALRVHKIVDRESFLGLDRSEARPTQVASVLISLQLAGFHTNA